MTTMLRYCQALLKSIPSTLQKAEEQVNQKNKLTGLTDTGDAIIQIINQQKELAQRIERHVEFFIKWDQQTELGLPLPLKDALRQMPEYASKYLEILTLQADNLRAKNTLKYLILFDQEQQLHEQLNKLFDKPLYTKPTKTKSLYNLAYSLGKTVIAPISKVLIALTFAVIITFPSIITPSLPIIRPMQATTVSAPKIDAEQFANGMRRHGWKCRVIKAGSDRPTIIIKEDLHQSDQAELEFVNLALEEYNINLVAVEGWAGEAGDSARGRTVLNAEEDFIKIILKDPRFSKIGLEDAELQEEALKIMIFQTMQYLISVIKQCETDITSLQTRMQELQQKKQKLLEELPNLTKQTRDENLSRIRDLDRDIIRMNQSVIQRIENQTLYNQLKQRIPETYKEDLNDCRVTMQEVENIYAHLLEKDINEISQIKTDIVRIKRSELWAQKIAVLASNNQSMIVVMGSGHTESFLKKLKEFGEYNIVIVEPYPQ